MAEDSYKRKLAAIFSTDVEGYSRLMGDNEVETIKTLTSYRELISKLIREHRGRVVDSPGDNLLAEFSSVVDAVRCAVEIQEELKERNSKLPENRVMAFRVGIHLGDVIEEDGRLYGDTVNIAARLEGLAEGGGICISGAAYDQVKKKLPFLYESMGERKVKNIQDPVHVYRVRIKTMDSIPEIKGTLKRPDSPSIAVLPFVNMSGDAEQEYFSDGLTEDLITDLSKISGLFVIARNSVFTYKGVPVNVEDVGMELGVRYVLEGSVRKAGNRVRITAQLNDSETGGHLWAERYDRDLKDIFDLQDEVTQKIVSSLAIKLKEDEQKRLARKGTENIEAYDYLLRGSEFLSRYTRKANAHAREMFEKALELDSRYALAYSLLGMTHLIDYLLGWSGDPDSINQAFTFSKTALALDDSIVEAHMALGNVYLWKKQHGEAVAELEKALSINPNHADCYVTLGNVLAWDDRLDEANENIQKAIRLNPYYPGWYIFRLGQVYCFMGDYEKAVETLKKALDIDPALQPIHFFLAFAYHETGRKEEAQAEIGDLLRLNPDYSLEILRKTLPLRNQAKLERILYALQESGLK